MSSNPRLRQLAWPLVVALLLTSVTGCVGEGGQEIDSASSTSGPAGPTTLVDWHAPNYTGDFAVRIVATPGDRGGGPSAAEVQDPRTCLFDWSFSGRNDGTGFGGSIELTWIEDGERERLNNTARVGAPGAHIASTATPTDQVFDIRWAVEGKREVPVEGETMLTAVTTGLAPWDDDGAFHPAVGLNVQCESGVVLEVAMTSSHVFAFKSQGLRGGAGASLGLPPDGSVGVHANVDDQHEIDIPTPTALVEIRETPRRGDALAKQGRLTLDHPAGTETRTFGSDPIQPIDLEGGPGSYELTVDRVTLGPSSLNGFIVGLEPIQLPSPQTPAALDRS